MKRSSVFFSAVLMFAVLPAISGFGMTVEELVVSRIIKENSLDTLWYELEVLANPLKITDLQSSDIKLRPLSQKEPLGLFTVLVEIINNGTVLERGQVRLRVRKFADVLVTSGRLKRHEKLATDKFTLRRMEVTSLREQPVFSFEAINGHRLKRNLSKGRILTVEAIEPVPDIEVGGEVSIVYADVLCTITVPGRVLQDGCVGQLVRVKNKASGKIVMARVADSSSVVIDP